MVVQLRLNCWCRVLHDPLRICRRLWRWGRGLRHWLTLLGGTFALRAHCALLLDSVPPEEPPSTPP